MQRRHRSLLAATLIACIAASADAQLLHQAPTGYTSVVVKFIGNNVLWNAKAIQWTDAHPGVAAPLGRAGDARLTQTRDSHTSAAGGLEIIEIVQKAEPELSQWQTSVGKPVGDMEITLMSPGGAPLAKYYLTGAIMTTAYSTENDTGGAKIVTLHVAFTAQSVTIEPTGQ